MRASRSAHRTTRPGFTLVEILIVLGIIGILAAILLPVFGRVREGARRTTCQSNLKQIHMAMELYLQDSNRVYPKLGRYSNGIGVTCSWPDRLYPYARNTALFLCPNADPLRDQYQPGCGMEEQTDDGPILFDGSYDITDFVPPTMGSLLFDFHFKNPSGTILVVDGSGDASPFGSPSQPTTTPQDLIIGGLKPRHSEGVNALYVDGHVRWQSVESLTHKGLWTLNPND